MVLYVVNDIVYVFAHSMHIAHNIHNTQYACISPESHNTLLLYTVHTAHASHRIGDVCADGALNQCTLEYGLVFVPNIISP